MVYDFRLLECIDRAFSLFLYYAIDRHDTPNTNIEHRYSSSKIRMEASNSRRDEDQQRTKSRDVICFAACGADQQLPLNPAVPADVFTACLTTPIKMALRWFMYRNPLQLDLPKDILDRIPGSLDKRKTPIGELNWIFTSITDTIAWNVLPLPLFQKLFRQDLLIASLSRNFLLADRIMRSLHCTWY